MKTAHLIKRLPALLAALAITTLSLPAFTGCQKAPVDRTAAEQQEDMKLAEKVKSTFATSSSFKFPDVQVAAFKGTVQLSGFVVSDDQKQAANALAKSVPGVQDVENEISLKR